VGFQKRKKDSYQYKNNSLLFSFLKVMFADKNMRFMAINFNGRRSLIEVGVLENSVIENYALFPLLGY
jgi:hypothetical protein